MTEFIPTKPEDEVIDNTNRTTIVIDEMPSDLAYGILVEALNQGNALTHDELVAEIKARTEGEETIIHFPEVEKVMHNFVCGVCQDCLTREESFYEEEKYITIYEVPDHVREAIERATEEIRAKHREETMADPEPTPNPELPLHM